MRGVVFVCVCMCVCACVRVCVRQCECAYVCRCTGTYRLLPLRARPLPQARARSRGSTRARSGRHTQKHTVRTRSHACECAYPCASVPARAPALTKSGERLVVVAAMKTVPRSHVHACTRAYTRAHTHTDAHVTGVGDDEMGEAVAQLTAMGFAEAEAREVIRQLAVVFVWMLTCTFEIGSAEVLGFRLLFGRHLFIYLLFVIYSFRISSTAT